MRICLGTFSLFSSRRLNAAAVKLRWARESPGSTFITNSNNELTLDGLVCRLKRLDDRVPLPLFLHLVRCWLILFLYVCFVGSIFYDVLNLVSRLVGLFDSHRVNIHLVQKRNIPDSRFPIPLHLTFPSLFNYFCLLVCLPG